MSSTVHPLDVDLADLVDGLARGERGAAIEAHLDGCLLCRVKCRRLRAAPAAPTPSPVEGPFASPGVVAPVLDATREPAPHDLWLAGDEERIVVLVRAVSGARVTVAPVTFDAEVADDETVIIEGAESPLAFRLAVYPQLTTELPRGALVGRIGVFGSEPDLMASARRRGTPIVDASDPRLDLRQYLADRLGSIESMPPDPGTAADAPPPRPHQVRSLLISDLRAMRGDTCSVRPLNDWQDVLLAQRNGWTPMATVDEVGIVLVVFDTPHGLVDDQDYDAARAVLTRLNATALVVLAQGLSESADVYDAPSLNHGIDTPSGRHTPPRPLITGLSPFDAVSKFLDQHTGVRMPVASSRGSVGHVDVDGVLRETAATALADAVRQVARFKIAPKRRGYESLAGAEEPLHEALGRSFAGESVVESLIELARSRDGDDG
ncbi:MAG: hypothetical protein ACRD12_08465 [Acidimicrobiales bacterium]